LKNRAPIIIILLFFFSLNCSESSDDLTPPDYSWEEHPSNPIIDSNWNAYYDLLINDPCVIKEGATYRMWFSRGPGLGVNHVKIYEGTSTDGITWNMGTDIHLEPHSDATATGIPSPDVTGTYNLNGELITDLYNDRPVFKLNGQSWYLWYDSLEGHYRISASIGSTGSGSWLGNGGTKVDGTYAPLGTSTGTLSITSDWDSEKIETPMVIKVGTTYHLYYSGFKIGDDPGKYQIGHATSPDGTSWTKDPANPVVSYTNDPNNWGFYMAGEPAVIYDNGTFYLYYVSAKSRGGGYTGDLAAIQGICLATSTDGSAFTFQQAVLTQSENYPVDENYIGYSTPFGMKDSGGKFHLFYDVAAYPNPGDWRQVALAHAVSDDPVNFIEIEHDIFVYGQGDWKDHEVRAPSVLEEDGYFKMWFAGDNGRYWEAGNFIWAIGDATQRRE
jgi:hypothetical protein